MKGQLAFFIKLFLIFRFDEKRYTSACIEPPVPKLFFAELDALNDCLVIENLEQVTHHNDILLGIVYNNIGPDL